MTETMRQTTLDHEKQSEAVVKRVVQMKASAPPRTTRKQSTPSLLSSSELHLLLLRQSSGSLVPQKQWGNRGKVGVHNDTMEYQHVEEEVVEDGKVEKAGSSFP